MKTATTAEQKTAVIALIGRLSDAAGPGYTRGDLARMAHGAQSTTPYLNVVEVLDPLSEGRVAELAARAAAVVDVVRSTSADTLEYL